MQRYWLDKEATAMIKEYCLTVNNDNEYLLKALDETVSPSDTLRGWLSRSVRDKRYSWIRYEALGCPCSAHTFRKYRLKLYFKLYHIVKEAQKQNSLNDNVK